jgi:hypothetical protein
VRNLSYCFVAFAAVFVAVQAWACDTPVYRFAMENWPPGDYAAFVFHEAPLTQAQRETLSAFQADLAEFNPDKSKSNLAVTPVNLAEEIPPEAAAVWERQEAPQTPWLVLRYPNSPFRRPDLWAGPLAAEALVALTESPARKELVQRLSQGDTAVWLFLESGAPEKDAPALKRIEAALEKAMTSKVPGASPVLGADFRPTFSLLSLSRDDAEEALLVEMLLGTEPDLRDYDEAMIFPVFGRGRALYAILGAGINEENLQEACTYILGACSCEVKDENPGTDLLLTAAWEASLESLPDAPVMEISPERTAELDAAVEDPTQSMMGVMAAGLGILFLLILGGTVLMAKRN